MALSLFTDPPTLTRSPAIELQKKIDRSVSRALFDHDYAAQLLTDPTIALADSGCPPQQYRRLHSIHAVDVLDFARQVYALFWSDKPKSSYREEHLSLVAGAAH